MVTWRELLSRTPRKPKNLQSLEAQFQLVNEPSVPTFIEVVDEVMRAYLFAPVSEPKLTNTPEIQDAIWGLKVGKAAGPNDILSMALKHIPLNVVSLLVMLFNAILQMQYFPPAWKHFHDFHYDPISLLNTIFKLLEKILLTRILVK